MHLARLASDGPTPSRSRCPRHRRLVHSRPGYNHRAAIDEVFHRSTPLGGCRSCPMELHRRLSNPMTSSSSPASRAPNPWLPHPLCTTAHQSSDEPRRGTFAPQGPRQSTARLQVHGASDGEADLAEPARPVCGVLASPLDVQPMVAQASAFASHECLIRLHEQSSRVQVFSKLTSLAGARYRDGPVRRQKLSCLDANDSSRRKRDLGEPCPCFGSSSVRFQCISNHTLETKHLLCEPYAPLYLFSQNITV